MSECIEIEGGRPLQGTVQISGAKNAALPILIATLLTGERCELENVPNLTDTNLVVRLLETFGAQVEFSGNKVVTETPKLVATEASYSLVKALRASFWVLAPLLARGRAARVSLPGGDLIGARPVDIHLEGLTKMGAEITVKHGVVFATAVNGLRPAVFDLRFPSVGATHQLLMAAALTPGKTVLRGCAREPEIIALANYLIGMGADISGAGGSDIEIHGRDQLTGTKAKLIGDRIEAGTYLLAAAATRGTVRVQGIDPLYFGNFLRILEEAGLALSYGDDWVEIRPSRELKGISVSATPFPGLATDLQAPLMAFLATVPGTSKVDDTVHEARFGHVSELNRMGANIRMVERGAIIEGVEQLNGAPVDGLDIRAAAALIVAGLGAEGTTQLFEPHHVRRGYEMIESKLGGLGARLWCRVADPDDFLFAGC